MIIVLPFMQDILISYHYSCRSWVKIIGNEDLVYLPIEKLHTTRFVCKDHFEKKFFNKKGNRLRKDAIPTLNLLLKPLDDELFKEFPYYIGSKKGKSF